ncbi:hypothetical protein SAMN04489726_7692 [Allokutzneria albata]|uniref:Uncharacterized protein n=1 Tax=Allokutzneria albata TaxID=211114 RepID=A0A1H0DB08_ALLAB|nr:hypothetical protein SAMN04489726_7692 [Allokutzneria albata]
MMLGYVVYVLAASLLVGVAGYRPSTLVSFLMALPAAGAVGYAVLWKFRSVNSREGLERHVQLEAMAAAFLITMLSSLTYALLEVFASVAPISMWFVWTVGMLAWCAASVVLNRKYG